MRFRRRSGKRSATCCIGCTMADLDSEIGYPLLPGVAPCFQRKYPRRLLMCTCPTRRQYRCTTVKVVGWPSRFGRVGSMGSKEIRNAYISHFVLHAAHAQVHTCI